MSRGFGEPPQRSVATHLAGVEYPVTRDELVEAAAQGDAPAQTINFLKALPSAAYASFEDVERDFAEAARRFGMGADRRAWLEADRSNIGRDAVENAPDGHVKHP
jgi:hypothetical protein